MEDLMVCYANQSWAVEVSNNYSLETLAVTDVLLYIFSVVGALSGVLLYLKGNRLFTSFKKRQILQEVTEDVQVTTEEVPKVKVNYYNRIRSRSCYQLKFCSPKEVDQYDVSDIKDIADSENKSYPQQEDPEEYCPGGYMPITYENILGDKYQVIRKLGYGHFSTVWLCENVKTSDHVAVKVCKSASVFTAVAADEIKLLQCTKEKNPDHPGYNNIVQMLDFFNCRSINGNHTAIAFEIMGPSLLHLIIQSEYQGLQLPGVKTIIKQVLLGLVYLHDECNIIHTDIKPENILIKVKDSYVKKMVSTARKFSDMGISMPKSYVSANSWIQNYGSQAVDDTIDEMCQTWTRRHSVPDDLDNGPDYHKKQYEGTLKGPIWIDPNIQVKIADLGNACWEDHHFSTEIQTKQYRALEVIMDAGYSYPADIWSLGCVAFELATGEYLFNPKRYQHCSATADHLTLIWEVLDGIPAYITTKGINAHRYFENGRLRHCDEHYLKIWKIEDVLVDKYEWKRVDAIPFASFIESMIEPDPQLRITAAMALQTDWINE